MNGIHVPKASRQQGFTLIELMIVVVVVAILAALAFPQYRDYVLRSNRAVAKSALTQIADRQEQFYVSNKSYAADLADLGYAVDGSGWMYIDRRGNFSAADGGNAIYRITQWDESASTFRLEADVRNAQQQDTKCTKFTLNQAGQRTAFAGETATTECW